MRCHQIPPKGASRPHETMSNSYKTQLELCYYGTGRLDKISQPQHSFVSADASGMFLLQLLQSKRKQALKHNVHWNRLSSEESRGGSCFKMCILSAAELSWCISVVCFRGKAAPLWDSLVLGKGHPIVLGKAFCVKMSPVSLEPRRHVKNKNNQAFAILARWCSIWYVRGGTHSSPDDPWAAYACSVTSGAGSICCFSYHSRHKAMATNGGT